MKFQELREQSSWLLWLSRHVSHVGKSVGDADGAMETQVEGDVEGEVELQVERWGCTG